MPAFTSSLAYYDGYHRERRERGPASLIQGLRDLFGATPTGAWTRRRWDQDGDEVKTDG